MEQGITNNSRCQRYTGTYTQETQKLLYKIQAQVSSSPAKWLRLAGSPGGGRGAQMAPYVHMFILSPGPAKVAPVSATQISGIFLSVDSTE